MHRHISWPLADQLHHALLPSLISIGLTIKDDHIDRPDVPSAAPVEPAPALRNALHLVRALGGGIGFWALVIPGVVWQSQTRFNEREPVFHMPGIVLPVQYDAR